MEKTTALPKNIRQIGDIRGREKIYLEDYVMTYIRKKEDTKEYLGIFLGERQEMEDQDCTFIRGILEIPKRQEDQEQEDWQKQIQEECRKYFPEWQVQGCCVIGTYPTQRMEQLSGIIPEAAGLLYHLQEQEETLYMMKNGQYERIKGYFVFYEQNKNMQEYLAEIFKENSVEKESLPDKAIRSFREKVKEKGLRKSSGMLKLASSFFVVVMLVIGAITVNRVEDIRAIRNQGGDLTAENEAVSSQVQNQSAAENTVQEEQRLVNGALIQEQSDPVSAAGQAETKQSDSVSAAGQAETKQSDSAAAAGQQDADAAEDQTENQAVTWQAGSDLDGPDSFWEETEEAQESAAVQSQAEVQESAAVQQTEAAQEAAAMRQTQAAYVIRQGDTLADICKRYYGSLDQLTALCEANGITDANVIMPGQKIVLP